MGPALQLFGNILGQGINNASNQQLQGQQNAQSMQQQQYAYGKNLEMWHMQNLYNSPKSQMQRFKEAGLNPNLIYGKGTSGNATSMPTAKAAPIGMTPRQKPDIDMLSMYNNHRATQAGIDNTIANTQHTNLQSTGQLISNAIREIDKNFHWSKSYEENTGLGLRNQSTRLKNMTQQRTYQMQAQRQELLQLQISLAAQSYRQRAMEYRWYPYKEGANIAGKVIGGALGIAGIGKLGKISKIGKRAGIKTPNTKGFSYYNRANQAFSQKHNPY